MPFNRTHSLKKHQFGEVVHIRPADNLNGVYVINGQVIMLSIDSTDSLTPQWCDLARNFFLSAIPFQFLNKLLLLMHACMHSLTKLIQYSRCTPNSDMP